MTTPEFTIEFNIGADEVVGSITLHVCRGGDVGPFISRLLDRLGWRAIDCSEGKFFDPASAPESYLAWRGFRDRVIGNEGKSGDRGTESDLLSLRSTDIGA